MSAQNLEVNDILFTNDFADFAFQYPNNVGVSTIIDLFKYLSQKITTAIENNNDNKAFITSDQVFNYAREYNENIEFPITISITSNSQTNSYLERISDLVMLFIATTLQDPIYSQVFQIEFSDQMQIDTETLHQLLDKYIQSSSGDTRLYWQELKNKLQ